MLDSTIAVEVSAVRVREIDSSVIWSLDRGWHPHSVVSEVSVDCDTVSLEVGGFSDFEATEASISIVFLCDIVRKLTLVEVDFTMVSIPLDEVTKTVLGEETVSFDIVSVDLQALSNVVLAVFDEAADVMVSSPEPGMINDNMRVVDLYHAFSRNF